MGLSEISVVKKLLIALLLINFFSIMFGYFVGSGSPVSNPTLTALYGIDNQTAQVANSLSDSFTANVIPVSYCSGFFCDNPLNTIVNIFGTFVNIVDGFFRLVIGLFILMGLSFYIVIFMIFGVIPSLFTSASFGFLQPIFVIIYGFTAIFTIVYGVNLIVQIILPFIPFLGGKGE